MARIEYICSVDVDGPANVTADVNNIAGNCTLYNDWR